MKTDNISSSQSQYKFSNIEKLRQKKPYSQHVVRFKKNLGFIRCQSTSELHSKIEKLQVAKDKVQKQASESQRDLKQEEYRQQGWIWHQGAKSGNIRERLKAEQLKPNKNLGQHFVNRDDVLEQIVQNCKISQSDIVLEVGPGTGNLSQHLVRTKAQIFGLELDTSLSDRLKKQAKEATNFRIIEGDILNCNFQDLKQAVQQYLQQKGMTVDKDFKFKVVSNLPYGITTEVLKQLLPQHEHISEIYFMIQEEVAWRLISGKTGTSTYRAMTLITQFFSEPTFLMKISKNHYYPPPLVNGSLVEFKILSPENRFPIANEKYFIKWISHCYMQRRKLLSNSSEPVFTKYQVEDALDYFQFDKLTRIENLQVKEVGKIFNYLYTSYGLQSLDKTQNNSMLKAVDDTDNDITQVVDNDTNYGNDTNYDNDNIINRTNDNNTDRNDSNNYDKRVDCHDRLVPKQKQQDIDYANELS